MELQEIDEFVGKLLTNGFTEGKKGTFSNGDVEFMIYGLGPYKVQVSKRVKQKSIRGDYVD